MSELSPPKTQRNDLRILRIDRYTEKKKIKNASPCLLENTFSFHVSRKEFFFLAEIYPSAPGSFIRSDKAGWPGQRLPSRWTRLLLPHINVRAQLPNKTISN